MTPEVRSYLVPTHDTFWQWKDNAEVVAWMDGKTIAFRTEICQVLRRLAPHGLPPFGAVVLLLAATRDNWQETSTEPGILLGILKNAGVDDIEQSDLLADVLGGLDKISLLDADLRRRQVAKEAIVETVFEGQRDRGSVETANQVVATLDQGLGEEVLFRRGGRQAFDFGARELHRELQDLRQGVHRVRADALELRIESGLDEIPEPVDFELTPAERVRALLVRLQDDNELRGLANLALKLMAAVTLPRNVSEPDEMPMGGFSDIANRGPLDRLLLSELAHDDLTLAVRVAVNEALYLRRESPPKTPPQQRTIFLDAGIRSWGVPRVFTTAVALALAASAEKNSDVVAYRARGCDAEPIDLTTRAGLVAHLAAIEPEMHPGNALATFKSKTIGHDDASEPILVSTEDVLSDPDFQHAMTREDIAPLLVATVTRDGTFRLTERTLRGTRPLRDAKFDLDELFADPKRTVPTLIDRNWARNLPAILSVEPFPLLLPHNVDPKRMWSVDGTGILALSSDRRLMLWTDPQQGSKQLSDEIPRGALWWASRDPLDDGHVRAVIGHADPRGLYLLNIDVASERCKVSPLEVDRGVRAICAHNGAMFAVLRNEVKVYDEDAGEFGSAFDIPKKSVYQRGRFFRSFPGEQWYALSFDGMKPQFERVFASNDVKCPKLQTMFEKDGADGPIGVTDRGDLYSTATGKLSKVQHGLSLPQVEVISSDGQRLVLGESGAQFKNVLLDVGRLSTERVFGDATAAAENSSKHIRPISLRTRFTFIFVDTNGVLTLTSRKQRNFAIDYDPASARIRLRSNDSCGAWQETHVQASGSLPASRLPAHCCDLG